MATVSKCGLMFAIRSEVLTGCLAWARPFWNISVANGHPFWDKSLRFLAYWKRKKLTKIKKKSKTGKQKYINIERASWGNMSNKMAEWTPLFHPAGFSRPLQSAVETHQSCPHPPSRAGKTNDKATVTQLRLQSWLINNSHLNCASMDT